MRERTLRNLDSLFRHYVAFCLSISLGGFALGTVVSFVIIPGLKREWVIWPLLGSLLGTGLCLIIARCLKARFHPRVIARLALGGQNGNA